eukprot:6600594-Pyramimonas_sp.AAC.1
MARGRQWGRRTGGGQRGVGAARVLPIATAGRRAFWKDGVVRALSRGAASVPAGGCLHPSGEVVVRVAVCLFGSAREGSARDVADGR